MEPRIPTVAELIRRHSHARVLTMPRPSAYMRPMTYEDAIESMVRKYAR